MALVLLVSCRPEIAGFALKPGRKTEVTIDGKNFASRPAENIVKIRNPA
jgi:hypothetical protein